jgi:hypothetical protein
MQTSTKTKSIGSSCQRENEVLPPNRRKVIEMRKHAFNVILVMSFVGAAFAGRMVDSREAAAAVDVGYPYPITKPAATKTCPNGKAPTCVICTGRLCSDACSGAPFCYRHSDGSCSESSLTCRYSWGSSNFSDQSWLWF